MKKYVIFNIFIQFIILFISVNTFFDNFNVKFLYSLFLIGIIFIPSMIEFILNIKIRYLYHYIITIICLILFMFLIAF